MACRRFDLCVGVFLLSLLSFSTLTWAWQVEADKAADAENTYWIFLTTGKSTEGVERSEIETMQAAHLNNFKRLHGEGKLFAAGPMADPNRELRGIVVIQAADRDALAEMFKPDPFVMNGYLNVEAARIEAQVGKFGTPVEPMELEEWRLVMLSHKADHDARLNSDQVADWDEYCNSLAKNNHARLALRFADSDRDWGAVIVFRKLDDKVLNDLVERLPPVKESRWTSSVFPLYLGKGTLE